MEAEKDFFIINKDEYIKEEIKIKRSIFICHLKYVENIENAKEFMSSISNQYKDANHNCWAYIIGKKAEIFHSSDAGEPSGTAGKPILNTLQKYNLTNIASVVTRYFGGTKLGVRGLIDAYSEITENAILSTKLDKLVEMSKYQVILDYDFFEIFQHYIKSVNGNIYNISYNNRIELNVFIEKKFDLEIQKYLNELSKKEKIIFEQI